MGERRASLQRWASEQLGGPELVMAPASTDASFRRYFRVEHGGSSYILMDSPPDKEDAGPFVRVSRLLQALGLHVPEVIAEDIGQGFLLLSDLGCRQYLDELSEKTVERLYGDALNALVTLQSCDTSKAGLPMYDRKLLMFEMSLFPDWLVSAHVGIELDAGQRATLDTLFERLAESALEQPAVCVHRDYHSRNLMVSDARNPGILDYQDAVVGPMTYDLVSLLRDCYISWPRERVEGWALGYREMAGKAGILSLDRVSESQFLRWFDWMGVQRHLKAAGIFARLNHRDGKPGYLGDIPRTLGYVKSVCDLYPELDPLGELVDTLVVRL